MEKQIIGNFSAITFEKEIFEFIVYNDNTMSCPTLGIDSIIEINLKPRFILKGKDFIYKYEAKDKGVYNTPERTSATKPSKVLIGEYNIDEELFIYLKENKMIKYSTDMAYLYGFNDKEGYDSYRNLSVHSPYKWAKKKARKYGTEILRNQKLGWSNQKNWY